MALPPAFPSLVAVIVTGPPALTAVTRPVPAFTVATELSLEVQLIARPVSMLPPASRVIAVSCCVPPIRMVAEVGATSTVATGGGVTVITGVVALGAVSLVAVIVAVPAPAAVTVTVAPLAVLTELAALSANTAVLLETQLTLRPMRVAPLASLGVAVKTCVAATITGVVGAERMTLATATGSTVIELVPVLPSLVAVIVTGPPAVTAVTSPFASTVATAGVPELHVTVRPVSEFPAASLGVATSCCVPPTEIFADGGVTVTVLTGGGGTGFTVITGVVTFGAASLEAVIVAVPAPAAVTVTVAPLEVLTELPALTVKTAALLETQFTVRPLRIAPAPSLGVAVSTCV